MDDKQIKSIITKGESQEIEFKESFHSSQSISKSICSLANTKGGILIFGVSNNGDIVGINENIDSIQRKISDANQAITPAPLISIQTNKINKKNVVAVIIQQASDTTFHTFHGAIYVRLGSTTRRLEGQTHLDYLRNRQILSFDESVETTVTVKDIDISKVNDYLRVRNQEHYLKTHKIEDFLLSNKLASKNGELRIKNAAVLLFAQNPIQFFPQTEIKVVQFSGNEPVEIISHRLIQEDLIGSIEQSIAFVKSHINKSIKINNAAKRNEEYDVPLDVVREALVNAIAHRDYFSKDAIQVYLFDNRIEITNPGSLPQGLTKELFGTISVQRNPITYRFLRDLGYVEGLGTGIPRMKNKMRKKGLSDPEFLFTDRFFRITLYNIEKKKMLGLNDLNERQKKAIDYLKKEGTLKAQKYCELNNVSIATAVHEINELISLELIKKKGKYRGAYYVLNK